jgi:hypothetical protein
MGLLTERDGAGDGYEEVTIPLVPIEAVGRGRAAECTAPDSAKSGGSDSGSGAEAGDRAEDGPAEGSVAKDSAPKGSVAEDAAAKGAAAKDAVTKGAAEDGAARDGAVRRGLMPGGGVMLRRRSALPTRRSVLYLHCERDPFVPEDLVSWYTERGFHFYVVDLRPEEALDKPARHRARPGQGERLARIDAACRHLRDTEGIDMIVVSAHAAGALTAALWCDARRDAGLADALILSRPAFARRLRRGLDIACPVLVLSPAEGQRRRAVGRSKAAGRSKNAEAVRLGPHVTWLRLEDGLDGQTRGPQAGRRQFFDQLGRWLGAYMYGSIRDQLL